MSKPKYTIEDGDLSELYIDADGYVCFNIIRAPGKRIWCTLHHSGWEAYVGDEVIWASGKITFPTRDDMDRIADLYQETIRK